MAAELFIILIGPNRTVLLTGSNRPNLTAAKRLKKIAQEWIAKTRSAVDNHAKENATPCLEVFCPLNKTPAPGPGTGHPVCAPMVVCCPCGPIFAVALISDISGNPNLALQHNAIVWGVKILLTQLFAFP